MRERQNPAPAVVLVVEDDDGNRLLVRRVLEEDGHTVLEASDGPGALQTLNGSPVDVVVLDLGLPGIDGLQVLSEIRRASGVPVLLLTARKEETERVLGLDAGADDYMVKPYSVMELSARVRALLRRAQDARPVERVELGPVTLDLAVNRAEVGGAPVALDAEGVRAARVPGAAVAAHVQPGGAAAPRVGIDVGLAGRRHRHGARPPAPLEARRGRLPVRLHPDRARLRIPRRGRLSSGRDHTRGPAASRGRPRRRAPADAEAPERRRGLRAFSESDEFAVAIFDALAEGVLVVDHRNRIVAMNRSAELLLGYESAALIGLDVRDSPWVLEDESGRRLDVHEWPIIETLDTGQPQGRLTVTVRPDGDRRIIVIVAMPLPRPDGRHWTVVSLLDVTRERTRRAGARVVGGPVPPARRAGARRGHRGRRRRPDRDLQPAHLRGVRIHAVRARRRADRAARARALAPGAPAAGATSSSARRPAVRWVPAPTCRAGARTAASSRSR